MPVHPPPPTEVVTTGAPVVFTVTVELEDAEQFADMLVASKVYVVVCKGFAIGFAINELLNPNNGLQLYDN